MLKHVIYNITTLVFGLIIALLVYHYVGNYIQKYNHTICYSISEQLIPNNLNLS